jgi:hypothetical protein
MASYDVSKVPPTGDNTRSRYALTVTPGGHHATVPATAAVCLNALAEQRIAEAEPLQPEFRTVQLKRVVRNDSGEYQIVAGRTITAAVTVKPTRSGRFASLDVERGALVDSFFLGSAAFAKSRDETVWEALRDFAEDIAADGEALRSLNQEVARLILLRAGVIARP